MDFEQALRMGGTVILEEGRRLETLGVSGSRNDSNLSVNSNSSPFNRHHPKGRAFTQPATPIVVPPTPADSPRPGTRRKQTAPATPQAPPYGPTLQPLSFDEVAPDPKRRSIRRSGATSSTPDLAAVARNAKERAAAVESSTAGGSSRFNKQPSPEPSSSQLMPPGSSQDRPQLRKRSSTSSSFSIVSSAGLTEDKVPANGYRPQVTKAEKVLGLAGRPLGSDGTTDPDRPAKMSIRNKTSALWTKMTGTTRARSNSKSVLNTPITPSSVGTFPLFPSQTLENPSPSFSVSSPPHASSYKPMANEELYISPLDKVPRRPSAVATKSLPPIYNAIQHDKSPIRTIMMPRQTSAPTGSSGRRRSMSVDGMDLFQVLAMDPGTTAAAGNSGGSGGVGGGSGAGASATASAIASAIASTPPPRMSLDQSKQKDQPPLPGEALPPTPTKWDPVLFGGWKLGAAGDLSDFRGAFAGLTATPNNNSAVPPSPTSPTRQHLKPAARQRAHSDPPEQALALKLPNQSVSTPTTPPFLRTNSLEPSLPDESIVLQEVEDEDNQGQLDRRTSRSSSRETSEAHQPPGGWSERFTSRLSTETAHPSTKPRSASASEPSVAPVRTPVPRRISEDVSSGSAVLLLVENPIPQRTIPPTAPTVPNNTSLLNSLPVKVNDTNPQASSSSLEVSVSDYTNMNSHGPTSSPMRAVQSMPATEGGKALAERCWQEDESFLPKEKIAEWLGGVGSINKVALTEYMNHFDFKAYRLDNAFRHLCGKLYLKAETQQVDRILDEFSHRFWECNPGSSFGSQGVVHAVSYSLLLLNTDLHIADLASHMSRAQFVRNTLFAINDQVRPPFPVVPSSSPSQPSPNLFARASTPDLTSSADGTPRRSGDSSSERSPSTLRKGGSTKRSGSIHSWKSGTREGIGGVFGNASTPTLLSSPGGTHAPPSPAKQERQIPPRPSTSSFVYNRAWEKEMEALLKDMYDGIKAQQILQPVLERASMSLTPTGTLISRSRSQRSYGGTAALKRGSIRGIQSLLGSQSPYSSTNSSTDGRVSPSPSSSTSIGEAASTSPSSVFTPTLGFASNLSHAIIKEAQEDDHQSVNSIETDDTSVSMTEEELALTGAPWAKEGMLCRKQYWESTGKRAKNKNWTDLFVVIQKGELSMFTFGESGTSGKGGGASSGGVGGGNWLSNAHSMGTVTLAHSLSHSLPPPGYNRSRPHCFVLTLSTDAVYFFQAGTEDLVNERVSTCNYWAARTSKEPLSGGVSNMEYGWSRAEQNLGKTINTVLSGPNDSTDNFDAVSVRSVRSRLSKKSWGDGLGGSGRAHNSPFAMEKIHINDWKPPMTPTVASTHDEETQMEALQKRVKVLKADIATHDLVQLPMQGLYQPKSPNFLKAQANWEAKTKWLSAEIFKYDTYVDSLHTAMSLRMKKRGEKVLEKTLVVPPDEFSGASGNRTTGSKRGLREQTIPESEEEPNTPGPGRSTFGHRREFAGVSDTDED
ncbi:hypothetical protein FRB93_009107 [Tulasnella sp. JGI-2019a]|nr:hypothetical protein FRB93_009107 [Tulasnella sp. JGI-2019a]